ncbi:unnamed protein product [Urochloa humidicola]
MEYILDYCLIIDEIGWSFVSEAPAPPVRCSLCCLDTTNMQDELLDVQYHQILHLSVHDVGLNSMMQYYQRLPAALQNKEIGRSRAPGR